MNNRIVLKKSIYILCAIAVILTAVLCFYPVGKVKAAAVPIFDTTSVLDDLQGMTIDGKEFNAADYPKDPYGSIKALTFIEYCYSQYENTMGNYGLYIYIYNPCMTKIDDSHVSNKLEMAIEFNEKDMPSKYKKFGLKYCDNSLDGLFYKYKVVDTSGEILRVIKEYAQKHGGKRPYYVSGVELVTSGSYNATEYNVGRQYTYEGFAKGYGDSENFPLAMESLGLKTIQTDLHYAFYRPNGESSEGNHTQHQLNSVYFSVPDALVEEYGLLTAVHMEWYEYLTKEILVVGNKEVYDAFKSVIGLGKEDYANMLSYGFTVHLDSMSTWYDGLSYAFNISSPFLEPEQKIDVLNYLFYTYGQEASSYTVSSEDLLGYIQEFEGKGEKINGKYYKDLFEDFIGNGRTLGYNELTVKADDKLSLTSYKLDQNWFQKLFGIKDYNLTVFNEIEGIIPITAKDMSGSKSKVCSALFIDESNYDEFKKFYDDTKNGKEKRTVYLLRYAVTDYYSVPATIVKPKTSTGAGLTNFLEKVDENAYMARQTAFLDLDLIDVTFRDEEGVETVIPVVASPIDGIGSASAPVNIPDGIDWEKIIGIILGVVSLIILLIIFAPLLPYLFRLILWVITLPFKLVFAIVKAIRNRSKRE